MVGGELEDLKSNLKESFSKIKQDIVSLNEEILSLKQEYKNVLSENLILKNKLSELERPAVDESLIRRIVEETVSRLGNSPRKENRVEQHFLKKINRNRKLLIKNRILELAGMKSLSLPEVKEILVDQEQLCSKATFYRYIERLNEKKIIETAKIDEREILVRAI